MEASATVSLATAPRATGLSPAIPQVTIMEKWAFSFLCLAVISGAQAQLKRYRVKKLYPAQAALQEEVVTAAARAGALEGREPTQLGCAFPLLPCALVFVLCVSLALYIIFAKEKEGEHAISDSEITSEEELIRDLSGLLSILQNLLWNIVQNRRRHQRLLQGTSTKVC